MLGIMGTVGIIFLIAFLSKIEKSRSQLRWTKLSPFTLLAFPLAAVLVIQEYSIVIYGLDELSVLYLLITAIHLCLVWLVCLLFEGAAAEKNPAVKDVATDDYDSMMPIMLVIGITAAMIQIFSFLTGAESVSVMGSVVQEEFQTEYSGGINFYLRLVTMICAAYFIAGISYQRKANIVFALLCLLPVFLTFVKSVVLISLVSGVIGNIIVNERRVKPRQVLIVSLLGFGVFFGVYLVEICIWDINRLFDPGTYEYVFAKMNFYLISGLQSFNIRVSDTNLLREFTQTSDGNLVLAPLMNILNWFGFDSRIDTASNVWTLIGLIPNYGIARSNVYSYIGQLVLYCGFQGSLIAEVIFTAIVCCFYTLYHTTGRTTALLVYAFLGSFFAFGWFDDYFCQTFWVYSLCIIAIIKFLFITTKTFGRRGRSYRGILVERIK